MDASSDIKAATLMARLVTGKPTALLNLARIDAANLLGARRASIETLADALIIERTLSGAKIADILASMSPAQRAERIRRKQMKAMTAGAAAFTVMTGGLTLQRI